MPNRQTGPLDWQLAARDTLMARKNGQQAYRIVFSHGYHCLRLETPGEDYHWMGQFSTVAQAKHVAQEREDQERRLRAWERYMRENDPPSDDPPWNPEPASL